MAAEPLAPAEVIQCARDPHVRIDSALLYNEDEGYGVADLFGKRRATYRSQLRFDDGYSADVRYAEGLGEYSFLSVDSAEGVRTEFRIISVK